MLASGSKNGKVKAWQIKTGKCLRRFEQAHTQGVTCISFSKDNSQILTGSFDATVKVHGLKSGKTLKVFREHTSFVNECQFSADGLHVISCSADGTVRIWDAKSTDCLNVIRPTTATKMADITVNTVTFLPKNNDQFIVCSRTPSILLMNTKGQTLQTFTNGTKVDFVTCLVSPRGEWIYGVGEDSNLYCFRSDSAEVVHTLKLHEKETIGITHHPHINLIASFADDGTVRLWKP